MKPRSKLSRVIARCRRLPMRSTFTRLAAPVLFLSLGLLSAAQSAAQPRSAPSPPAPNDPSLVDITRATIVAPPAMNVQERTAVRVLVEEVAKRTNVRLPVTGQWPGDTVPV